MVASNLPDGMLTIHQVAEATGLTPSLLRIWESRYGWPTPRRLANGYRTYHPRQLDDIRRVAELVHAGKPIGSIISDGLPSWPSDPARAPRRPRLSAARGLPAAPAGEASSLREDLLNALENDRAPAAEAALQRLAWVVRPADEALSGLLPALVGSAELAAAGRPLRDGNRLLELVANRARQLLRATRAAPGAVRIAPLGTCLEARAVAAVAAWLLTMRGTTVVLSDAALGEGCGQAGWWLATSDGAPASGPDGRIDALSLDGAIAVATLVREALPWQAAKAA